VNRNRALGRVKVAGFIALVLVAISALASTQIQPPSFEDDPELEDREFEDPPVAPTSAAPAPAGSPSATDRNAGEGDVGGGDSGEGEAGEGSAEDWSAEDWSLFESKIRWARSEGLDQAEVGDAVSRLALSFVGTTYTPGTLEAPGPERLVINFRELDCVTFVETVLAMTSFLRSGGEALLDDPSVARGRYERHLMDLRYRGGRLDGYPSRLHYFSEWLTDNDARGLVRLVTGDLDHEVDSEPITFMSSHATAYRQLSDPAVLGEIETMEAGLNALDGRMYVPAAKIASVVGEIESGDVIAATSTVEGLDVAHTGFAVWVDGRLHLVHAPLVGKEVELSVRPLADRILSIASQDGIMVARPTGS